MWQVTLTAVDPRNPDQVKDTTVCIYSDHWYDLLKNEHFRWGTLERMMDRGTLKKVAVDYRPNFTGVRRIRKGDDGLYYLFIDGEQYGEGHETRQAAWEQGEGIVRAAG